MSRTWQVLYEGTASTSGTAGSPNIVVHFTFYESDPLSIYVYVATHARSGGLTGAFTSSALVSSFPSALPSDASSWKITSTGTNTCSITSLATGALATEVPSVLFDISTDPKTYTTGMGSTASGASFPGQDDSYIPLRIPWAVTFLGTSYASGNVFLSSNTYLTFGGASYEWSGLSASKPALPKLMIGAADNSFQKVFATSDTIPPKTPTLGVFDMTKTFGDSPFTITQPSSESSGAFTYSVISGTSVISMSGTTITILTAGTATVQATQADSGNYTSATKDATIQINQLAATLSASPNIFYRKFVSGDSISFNVTSNAGTVTRTHESSNSSIFSIPTASSPSGTILAPGKITINVIQPATTNYTAITTNQLITIIIVGSGINYSSETFPASFDLTGLNLSSSVFSNCNLTSANLTNANLTNSTFSNSTILTSANLFGATVNASTNFTNATLTSVRSGRIIGKTPLLPPNFTMI